jgi:hypothetical protein
VEHQQLSEHRRTNTGWGGHLVFVSTFSREYEPGFYALFNSAIESGFAGTLLAIVSEPDRVLFRVKHPQLQVRYVPRNPDDIMMVWRLRALADLPPGNYVLTGADFVVERPCEFLFEALDDALLASSVPHLMYDIDDVFLHRQCRALGWPTTLKPSMYLCADFLGFKIPRDLEFLRRWRDGAARVLRGTTGVHEHPVFPFLEQDVLNVLLRQPEYTFFTVSSRQMEFGSQASGIFYDRPFPASRQGALKPGTHRRDRCGSARSTTGVCCRCTARRAAACSRTSVPGRTTRVARTHRFPCRHGPASTHSTSIAGHCGAGRTGFRSEYLGAGRRLAAAVAAASSRSAAVARQPGVAHPGGALQR